MKSFCPSCYQPFALKPDSYAPSHPGRWDDECSGTGDFTLKLSDLCEGHPAGPYDPMGQTVYCDGSCARGKVKS